MGKLGGREPNYHSDLDVIFLYETQGRTVHRNPAHQEKTTSNQHFFSQLGQRIIRVVSRMGPLGRLFEIDPRLRPTGKSGSLAISLKEFQRYFSQGQGQLWERQALCKARTVLGSDEGRKQTMDAIGRAIVDRPWQASDAEEIREMRMRMQQTASDQNLKRGWGGTVDIEFIVQMLQMKHAAATPKVLVSGTLDAIEAMHRIAALSDNDTSHLTESYCFLRSVESRLRLMNTTALHDLPDDQLERKKLAFLIREDDPNKLQRKCHEYRRKNRECFQRIFDAAALDRSA